MIMYCNLQITPNNKLITCKPDIFLHAVVCVLTGFLKKTLTQWSRACRKSKSSSVHSSCVCDLEPTRAVQASSLSLVWVQCSDASHFARIVSKGSWQRPTQLQMTHQKNSTSQCIEKSGNLNVCVHIQILVIKGQCGKCKFNCLTTMSSSSSSSSPSSSAGASSSWSVTTLVGCNIHLAYKHLTIINY